jgi:hypothetical protein
MRIDRWLSVFAFLTLALINVQASIKYNQRTFLTVKAVNLVDATKHGFRILLRDDFIKEHMAPTLLPTLYVTAIPLQNDENTYSKVFYPDNVSDDKQVSRNDSDL